MKEIFQSPLRVAITTLGCKVNYAEMADLAGKLAAAGCDIVPEDEWANVRVLNSCTVTHQADITTRQRLRQLKRNDPNCHLILTGCSVDGNRERYFNPGLARLSMATPIQNENPLPVDGVDMVFNNAAKDLIADYIFGLNESSHLPAKSPATRSRAFIKVQDGCDHRCTYCIVSKVRGKSISISPKTVQQQVSDALSNGYNEVVLTGVDLGSYGKGTNTKLANLVETLLSDMEKSSDPRLRLSSINANDINPALIALNAHPQLCAHWHIPLQSGSDAILKAMHRGYRRAQYLKVIDQLRQIKSHTEFTTDVMVAFPGETEEDHTDTLTLIKEASFLHCHVFRYSPRRDTSATDLSNHIADEIAKKRSQEARAIAAEVGLEAFSRGLGEVHQVVWDKIDGGIARGIASTWHTVTAPVNENTRLGGLQSVLTHELVDGGIHGRIVSND